MLATDIVIEGQGLESTSTNYESAAAHVGVERSQLRRPMPPTAQVRVLLEEGSHPHEFLESWMQGH